MRRLFSVVLGTALAAMLISPAAVAAKPGVGELYYERQVVRTVVPPATMPMPAARTSMRCPGSAPSLRLHPATLTIEVVSGRFTL